MTDRVEEIRERVGKASDGTWRASGSMVAVAQESWPPQQWLNAPTLDDALFIANAPSDIRFLLSEIQRLRKVEEAARVLLAAYDVRDPDWWTALAPLRSSLSNALEQHIPEPVREEMER